MIVNRRLVVVVLSQKSKYVMRTAHTAVRPITSKKHVRSRSNHSTQCIHHTEYGTDSHLASNFEIVVRRLSSKPKCYKRDDSQAGDCNTHMVSHPISDCDKCQEWDDSACDVSKCAVLNDANTFCDNVYAEVRHKDDTFCEWTYRCCKKYG